MNKRRIVIGSAALLLLLALLAGLAVFVYVNNRRREAQVEMDGTLYHQQDLLDYRSPYDQVIQPLCKPCLQGEDLLLYSALLYAYEQDISEIRMQTEKPYTEADVFSILSMVKADYPQFMTTTLESKFSISRDENGMLTIQIPETERLYIVGGDLIEEAAAQLEAMPAAGSEDMGFQVKKAYAIYSYMLDAMTYQAEGSLEEGTGWNFTIQGALVDKQAQCNGLAGAFQLFCRLQNIECYKVFYRGRDVGREYGHVWNVVRMDGQWYHVDITAALECKESQVDYLNAEGLSPQVEIPDFFGMSDAEALADGLAYTDVLADKVPACPAACSGRDALYDVKEAAGGEEGAALAARAGEVLAARQEEAVPSLRIRFADQTGLENFRANLFDRAAYISALMENVTYNAGVYVFQNQSTLYIYLQPA